MSILELVLLLVGVVLFALSVVAAILDLTIFLPLGLSAIAALLGAGVCQIQEQRALR